MTRPTPWRLAAATLLALSACRSAPPPARVVPPPQEVVAPPLGSPTETAERFTAREPEHAPGEHPLPGAPRPLVKGSLDREVLQRVIRQHMARFKVCYERHLRDHPDAPARPPRVEFRVTADGSTAGVVVASGDPDLDACLARQLESMRFPPPAEGEIHITYPIH